MTFQDRTSTTLVLQEQVRLLQHRLHWEQLVLHLQWLRAVLHVRQGQDLNRPELLHWLSCGVWLTLLQESKLQVLCYHVLLLLRLELLLHAIELQLLDLWQLEHCHLLGGVLFGLEDHHHL